ncbi:hypothetical protein D9M70_493900 [compost metagenome]
MVTIDADVRDAGRRHQLEHAFQKPVAGAQDRGEHKLLALEDRRVHFLQRSLDPLHRQFEIARDLVAEQRRDLPEKPAKTRG